MTNYDKWAKFSATLHSDSESEEEAELARFTKKNVTHIHIPPVDFVQKEKLCELLEELPEFDPEKAKETYDWSSVGGCYIPGYNGTDPNIKDMWRLHYDDSFVYSQTVHNPGARALLGTRAFGHFVVTCSRAGQGDRKISRKEVADLIMNRQNGKDAEKITREREEHAVQMEKLDSMGIKQVNLPDAA